MDAVLLLGPEQVVDQQLDRFGDVATAAELVVVQLIRQLECVPVADRPEELDVAGDLAFHGRDDEHSLGLLPEAVLAELALERGLGHDPEREEVAAHPNGGVRLIEPIKVRAADGAQLDQFSLEHRPTIPV